MAIGPGKYNDELTKLRQSLNSNAALLIVMDGPKGPGFACQAPIHYMLTLPGVLRDVADQIEAEQRKGEI